MQEGMKRRNRFLPVLMGHLNLATPGLIQWNCIASLTLVSVASNGKMMSVVDVWLYCHRWEV